MSSEAELARIYQMVREKQREETEWGEMKRTLLEKSKILIKAHGDLIMDKLNQPPPESDESVSLSPSRTVRDPRLLVVLFNKPVPDVGYCVVSGSVLHAIAAKGLLPPDPRRDEAREMKAVALKALSNGTLLPQNREPFRE